MGSESFVVGRVGNAGSANAGGAISFALHVSEGGTIEVPVREEEVNVEKRPVVTEEVEIGKRAVQDTERVSGTVRREEARVEREGDVEVEGEPRLRPDEPRR